MRKVHHWLPKGQRDLFQTKLSIFPRLLMNLAMGNLYTSKWDFRFQKGTRPRLLVVSLDQGQSMAHQCLKMYQSLANSLFRRFTLSRQSCTPFHRFR